MNIWNNKEWQPMLLHEVRKAFNDSDYIFELKFDGFRTILFASTKEVIIHNRKGQDITYLYPELQRIKKIVTKNTIFDGEIVMLENGVPSFQKLQTRVHLKDKEKILYQSKNNPILFMCFDILYENVDLTKYPLIERKKRLSKIKENDVFLKVKQISENGISFFKEVKKRNLEGIIAKHKSSIYEINTRTNQWLKIKNLKKNNFFIGGFIEKENNAIISLLLGEKKENKLFYVGKVIMAKKNKLYEKIKKMKPRKTSSFQNYHECATFIKPIHLCQVEYLERTNNNQLRQPIFIKEI